MIGNNTQRSNPREPREAAATCPSGCPPNAITGFLAAPEEPAPEEPAAAALATESVTPDRPAEAAPAAKKFPTTVLSPAFAPSSITYPRATIAKAVSTNRRAPSGEAAKAFKSTRDNGSTTTCRTRAKSRNVPSNAAAPGGASIVAEANTGSTRAKRPRIAVSVLTFPRIASNESRQLR